jgi:hypothetical protein
MTSATASVPKALRIPVFFEEMVVTTLCPAVFESCVENSLSEAEKRLD